MLLGGPELADGASLRKQCKKRCQPAIRACVAAGERRKPCRKRIVGHCVGTLLSECVSSSAPSPVGTGTVALRISDLFGSPVEGAAVRVQSANGTASQASDSDGAAVFTGLPSGSVFVSITEDGFENVEGMQVAVLANGTMEPRVTLQPAALPSVSAVRVNYLLGEGGPAIDFQVDVHAVDAAGTPLSLVSTDFTVADFDGSSGSGRIAFQPLGVVPMGGADRGPYSATMLLDQSGSIDDTDPADSRIQAAKLFMSVLDGGDQALLAAFASGNSALGGDVVTFGSGFTTDGRSYFGTLDRLADTVGGGTPLYRAAVTLIHHTADNAPTPNRAVVVFTDGQEYGRPERHRRHRASGRQPGRRRVHGWPLHRERCVGTRPDRGPDGRGGVLGGGCSAVGVVLPHLGEPPPRDGVHVSHELAHVAVGRDVRLGELGVDERQGADAGRDGVRAVLHRGSLSGAAQPARCSVNGGGANQKGVQLIDLSPTGALEAGRHPYLFCVEEAPWPGACVRC